MANTRKLVKRLSLKAKPIRDSFGEKSQLMLSKNNVAIGNVTYPKGKLHILDEPKTSNGNTVVIGDTNGANLRLGYHYKYSWVQSHGLKPLHINELGNNVIITLNSGNVGIGTDEPTEKLDVKGVLKVDSIIVNDIPNITDKKCEYLTLKIDSRGYLHKDISLEQRLTDLEKKYSELLEDYVELKSLIEGRESGKL